MSLAEGRVACSVAGALVVRGGACQSRIHSGGAIDLDSFSPGGAGGAAGKHIRCKGGGGVEGAVERGEEKGERCFEGVDSSSMLKQISALTMETC